MNFDIKDGKLVITVDISAKAVEAAQPSASGKTKTLATTGGYNWGTGVKGLGFNLTVSHKA
jgi:hypothetical protein